MIENRNNIVRNNVVAAIRAKDIEKHLKNIVLPKKYIYYFIVNRLSIFIDLSCVNTVFIWLLQKPLRNLSFLRFYKFLLLFH